MMSSDQTLDDWMLDLTWPKEDMPWFQRICLVSSVLMYNSEYNSGFGFKSIEADLGSGRLIPFWIVGWRKQSMLLSQVKDRNSLRFFLSFRWHQVHHLLSNYQTYYLLATATAFFPNQDACFFLREPFSIGYFTFNMTHIIRLCGLDILGNL